MHFVKFESEWINFDYVIKVEQADWNSSLSLLITLVDGSQTVIDDPAEVQALILVLNTAAGDKITDVLDTVST